jgi:hypothetical protein
MKTYTKEEIAAARRMAFHYLFSIDNIVLNRRFRYDHRTRIGNLAASIIRATPVDRDAIRAKKRERAVRKNAMKFSNVLTNPLVIDFKKNGGQVLFDRLRHADGRNHWAKGHLDFKILKIIANRRTV